VSILASLMRKVPASDIVEDPTELRESEAAMAPGIVETQIGDGDAAAHGRPGADRRTGEETRS
jgi:hypothetical protein